jgi:SPP1 family predicted phage head-tail adaptor
MITREKQRSIASVLCHRVDIQSETRTADGEGGYTGSWSTTLANVPAAIDPIQARQQFQNKSVNVDATHWIKVRGDVEVSEINRISWGSRVFEILTIENINENGVLKFITTKEKR